MQVTHTVPIVFPMIADPVGGGFADSLARPGGNATGFMLFEYSISGKWLGLLKQIAPDITRVAVFGDPDTATGRHGSITNSAASTGTTKATPPRSWLPS